MLYTWVMPDITSFSNPQVKNVVKLRTDRRHRQVEGLTLVEGQYEVEVAFNSGVVSQRLFVCEDLCKNLSIAHDDVEVITVSRPVFEKMSYRENPDGILAIINTPARSLYNLRTPTSALYILVEAVEKPGNLGAVFRTADAAGVDGVLVCDTCVDLFNPSVIRASRGTVFSVPCAEVSNDDALAWLRAKGIETLAASPQGDKNYSDVDLWKPVCLAFGAEDVGLTEFWLGNSDQKIKIPMLGTVNSLNVSTSAAIILYEALRQRIEKFQAARPPA